MITSAVFQLLAILTMVGYWIHQRRKRQQLLKQYGIPGPEPHFIFGNILDTQSKNVPATREWIKEYGKIFAVYECGPTVYVADPELARQIQVKDFRHFVHRRTLVQKGGFDANPKYEVSVISYEITGQRWKEQRALITSAFTSSKIRASVPLVNEGIDVLLDNIRESASQPDFDIYDLFQRLTMDTIGRSAFGTNFDIQKNPDNEFYKATKRVFDNASKSWSLMLTFMTLVFPEFFHVLYPLRQLQRKFLNFIGKPTHFSYQMQMCVDIVRQRKEKKLAGHATPDDFLQRLIDATLTAEDMSNLSDDSLAVNEDSDKHQSIKYSEKRERGTKIHRMNDEEVAANAGIMFDAGFETTSTFLAFLFHVLVNRQDIQDKIRDEVLELKSQDGSLDYNTIHSLPYLDSVIHETLRYYPPVTGFVTRQSSVEYKYKDFTIPADVAVSIAVAAMQHDPEYWEKPETFDPLRFYGENKNRIQSPAFQAFGAGPRNCLGMRFALMEAKLTVARILSEFQLIPGSRTESFDRIEIEYKFLTQNPKKGVFVKAIPIIKE